MSEAARRLRESIEGSRTVLAPFVYDALQAKIAEAAGFEAVYMTGFGTAAARGYPDLGLLTMTEMVNNVRSIARAVKIPVICDADTGYGNPINVARTVAEYEDAGAAALHIEDQVWPKRCGYLSGKEVIPIDQMIPKVRAACDARSDSDLVIIARTDSLQPNGWDDAERRARAYRDAGADLIFVDGIRNLEELDTYSKRLGDLPLLYNGQLLKAAELAQRGFRVVIHSGTLGIAYSAMRDAMRDLRETGQIRDDDGARSFGELIELLGVRETLEGAKKYD
ncbi:MAG: isocitrate lyase/PEP mutase family protein [Myxococcota bacterium]